MLWLCCNIALWHLSFYGCSYCSFVWFLYTAVTPDRGSTVSIALRWNKTQTALKSMFPSCCVESQIVLTSRPRPSSTSPSIPVYTLPRSRQPIPCEEGGAYSQSPLRVGGPGEGLSQQSKQGNYLPFWVPKLPQTFQLCLELNVNKSVHSVPVVLCRSGKGGDRYTCMIPRHSTNQPLTFSAACWSLTEHAQWVLLLRTIINSWYSSLPLAEVTWTPLASPGT